MEQRPEDVHNPSDDEMIYDSEEEEQVDNDYADMNDPDTSESDNSNEQESSSDSDGDSEIDEADHHQNDRPDYFANDDVVYDSGEEVPNANNGFPEDDDAEELVFDSEESDGEEIVIDSGESDEQEEDNPDSDENSEAGHEENNGYHNNMFEAFFYLNIERRGLDAPMVAQGNTRKYENILVEIAKVLRYKETYESLMISFEWANARFDNCSFPTTMNQLWKWLNRNLNHFNQSIVCGICWENLGAVKVPTRNCQCGRTGPGKTDQLGTFLYLNLPAQLQALLRKTGMATALQYPWTRVKQNPDAMEDIYDASVYRELSADGGFLSRGRHNYSLAIWTDGVDPVVSAPVQIWPVFVQVLELSPRARQRNSLLGALYVGPRKPEMGNFLGPFVRELRGLYRNGIIWRPERAAEVTSRFVTLVAVADPEGRYDLLAHMRHNAYWGCTFCYAIGVRVGERGQFHIYPYNDGNANNPGHFAADRTDGEMRDDARAAVETQQPVHGVRGISALSIIPGLDLRTCQMVEPLHCMWERNFTRLYKLVTHPETPNFITPANIEIVSTRIESTKPPTKLARRPRPLKNFAKFKGTEYRNLAWYYWLPCAHDFMSREHIEHFALFAEATYVLNKDSISPEDLNRVEGIIDRFRQQSPDLFGEEHQSYSLHLLKHVVRCVQELGPQWVASGFWFESLNRTVKNYITSPTDRSMQIACRMLLAQFVEKSLDWEMSPVARSLLQKLINKKRWVMPPRNATGRFILHTRGIPGVLDQQEIAALIEAGYRDVNEELPITRYKRVEIDGVYYQPPSDRPVKYDNSVIHVTPPNNQDHLEFIRISSIIRWQRGAERMDGVIGTKFTTVGAAFNTTYMKIVQQLQDLVYLPLESINAPAVLVESLGTIYISPLPNRWDVD